MKRVFIILLSALFLFFIPACSSKSGDCVLNSADYPSADAVLNNRYSPEYKEAGAQNAAYAKSYDTLESLYEGSDAIVIGTAGNIVDERQFGVVVAFTVQQSIKGSAPGSIGVLQMKQEEPLKSGGTYLLVMLKEDYGKENEYSILTGCQGMFELNKDGTVNFFDALGGTNYEKQLSSVAANSKGTESQKLIAYFNGLAGKIG